MTTQGTLTGESAGDDHESPFAPDESDESEYDRASAETGAETDNTSLAQFGAGGESSIADWGGSE